MPDRELMQRTLQFLIDARNEWQRIAKDAESANNQPLALRARNQEWSCEREIARLQADLAANEQEGADAISREE